MLRMILMLVAMSLTAPVVASADWTPWKALSGKMRQKREGIKERASARRLKRQKPTAVRSAPAAEVPELDQTAAFSGAALALGGLAVMVGRRRRRLPR